MAPVQRIPHRRGVASSGEIEIDWSSLQDGLFVTLVGMIGVFVVLSIIATGLCVFEIIDRWRKTPERQTVPSAAAPVVAYESSPPTPAAPEPAGTDLETIAAIAVSFALAEARSAPASRMPGAPRRAAPSGSWFQAGLGRQISGQRPSQSWRQG